ncbi:enoyl-CoA hydratase/isomerase family protein [Shewanella algae]|nr:enoyl-CoA hydratase/isomerase family protein [Shewanella algae]MBO2661751.1 enoyl-CoA hydratase/isomerase family protein [Shewanella algae]
MEAGMDYQYLTLTTDSRGVSSLVMNRPQLANAFDEMMIAELIDALESLARDPACRVLLLKANGKHFSAGADLNWMRKQAAMDFDDNLKDAAELARLMATLDQFPKPSLALVQGAAFGGALGLVCCCDIAIATPKASFCLSEVKLGLIPAVISPYVRRAMGERQARRYMLTAERFDAEVAKTLQLVHQVADDLEAAAAPLIESLLGNSPQALNWCKQLISDIRHGLIDEQTLALTGEAIARIRVSAEGQEGLNAFFEKRPPNWQGTSNNTGSNSSCHPGNSSNPPERRD